MSANRLQKAPKYPRICAHWPPTAPNQKQTITWATWLNTRFRGHLIHLQPPTFHHLAQKSPSEGSQIARLQLPCLGEFRRATPSLHKLSVEKVVKGPPCHSVPRKLFYFGPCWLWPMLGHTPTGTANPSRPCTPGRPRNCGPGGVQSYSRPRGGGGGMKEGGGGSGVVRRGGVAVMKGWGVGGGASLGTRLGMWWCKGWGW